MEPVTTLAFAISLASISLESQPLDKCIAWKTEQPEQRLCVEVEPPCGKSVGTECLGRADLVEPRKPTYKRKYFTKNGKRYYRLVRQ